MSNFFPETSSKDVLKSVLVIIFLVLVAFLPTLLLYQGLFLGTRFALVFFAFFFVYGLYIYRNFPFQTLNRLSEAVTIPFRLLSALLGGFIVALIATHLSSFNIIAARVLTGFFASAIEGICVYYLSMYTSMILIFMFGRRNK